MRNKNKDGDDKKFRKGFWQGKEANNRHPTYVYAKEGNKYKFIGITHAEITEGTKNIKLDKNPNPEDKKESYIRPKPSKDESKKFGRRLKSWSFGESDKGKVNGVIKKGKKKKGE